MAATLTHYTTTDGYQDAGTLEQPGTERFVFIVVNASIVFQLARAGGGAAPDWQANAERRLLPGMYSFERVCDGVRVKSAVSGTPAIVELLELLQDSDLPD